jgi:hypothetical protein
MVVELGRGRVDLIGEAAVTDTKHQAKEDDEEQNAQG